MKLLLATSVLALAQLSLADFYIFRVDATNSGGNTEFGYRIADVADPNCASLKKPWYGLKAEVSGKTLGVACSGAGCTSGVDPGKTDIMTMHFSNSPPFHWIIRKDQNWDMLATDGKSWGRCYPVDGKRYECPSGKRQDHGYSKFRCETKVSANEIANAK